MVRIRAAVLLLTVFLPAIIIAQDTLPKFSAVLKSQNRIIISWANNYPVITQVSIQRSIDSLKNFKTILTVPDPSIPQNGFVDVKSPSPYVFYRLFIVLDNGQYLFSKSKRAAPDTAQTEAFNPDDNKRVLVSDSLAGEEIKILKEKLQPADRPKEEKFFIVKKSNILLSRMAEKDFKRFRDSIVYKTKDTLVFNAVDTILINPFIPKEIYKISKFIYAEKYGNVMIALPDATTRRYNVRFFEGDKEGSEKNKRFIFEIKKVESPSLVLDKTNFIHAGWFWFELFENGTLKEKNKLYIPKDF